MINIKAKEIRMCDQLLTTMKEIHNSHYRNVLDYMRSGSDSKPYPLFEVNPIVNLPFKYISYLKRYTGDEVAQKYNCRACKDFLDRYHNIAFISDDGELKSLIAHNIKPTGDVGIFGGFFEMINQHVENAKILGGFYSKDADILGTPYSPNGGFHHFSTSVNAQAVNILHNPVAEDYRMVTSSLGPMDVKNINKAITIVSMGKEEAKFRPRLEWLKKIKKIILSDPASKSKLWLEVAKAPKGWCNVKSSSVGKLIQDIDDYGSDTAKKKFEERTETTVYMRPKSEPSNANIEQAEKIIEQLGFENSLERRFATIDEIETIWKPSEENGNRGGGIFGHLKKRQSTEVETISGVNKITLERFKEYVLPSAEKISVKLYGPFGFGAITAAVHSDSKPLWQWGHHFAWFCRGHYIASNIEREVLSVSELPCNWSSSKIDFTKYHGLFFACDGIDLECKTSAIFPEIVVSELHQVRKTIEAFSNSKPLISSDGQKAIGLFVFNSQSLCSEIHVTSEGVKIKYHIDRLR